MDARFTEPVMLVKKDFPMKCTPLGVNLNFWSEHTLKMPFFTSWSKMVKIISVGAP